MHQGDQLFSLSASFPDQEPPKAGASLDPSLCLPGPAVDPGSKQIWCKAAGHPLRISQSMQHEVLQQSTRCMEPAHRATKAWKKHGLDLSH